MAKQAKVKMLNPQKIKMSKATSFTLLTVGAFVGAFSTFFFVVAANLYMPGLGGMSNGIAYTINDILWATGNTWAASRASADAIIYWVIYGLANIPIIWITTRWFSRRFLTYSLYYFVVNFIFSMLFANLPSLSGGLIDQSTLSEAEQTLATLFFSFIGGLTSGIAVGLAFKVGACTMGLDPVVKNISRTKNLNIGPILSIIAISTTTTFIIIRGFIPNAPGGTSAIEADGFLRGTIFSPEYIGSWLFIIAYSVVADAVYSSAKKVEIFATSEHTDRISEYFNSVEYHRGHTIYKLEGGYSHKEKKAIKMIVNFDEMYDVVKKIAALDDKAFITVKEIFRVYDVHNWTTMTDEDKEKEKERFAREQKRIDKLSKKK